MHSKRALSSTTAAAPSIIRCGVQYALSRFAFKLLKDVLNLIVKVFRRLQLQREEKGREKRKEGGDRTKRRDGVREERRGREK